MTVVIVLIVITLLLMRVSVLRQLKIPAPRIRMHSNLELLSNQQLVHLDALLLPLDTTWVVDVRNQPV